MWPYLAAEDSKACSFLLGVLLCAITREETLISVRQLTGSATLGRTVHSALFLSLET